jgi:hypothetical protein
MRLSAINRVATLATLTNAGLRNPEVIRRRLATKNTSAPRNHVAGSNQEGPFRSTDNGTVDAGREVTLTVRTELNVPFAAKFPAAGVKLHESPVGRFGQLKVNASESPLCELIATLNVAEEPTGIVAEFGEKVLLTPWMCSTAAGALCVTPSAVAEATRV